MRKFLISKKARPVLSKKQVRALRENQDAVEFMDKPLVKGGWLVEPTTWAFVGKAKELKAMNEVIAAIPHVFRDLDVVNGYMLAWLIITDMSSMAYTCVGIDYTKPFPFRHDGEWMSPWYHGITGQDN